jgi:hypothetical protein
MIRRCAMVSSASGFCAHGYDASGFIQGEAFSLNWATISFSKRVYRTTVVVNHYRGHSRYSLCSKGYGHSMMKRVYRRMGLSSLRRNSEVGPLAPAGGCWECGAMLWPGAGEQSRTDRWCAAASCAAANLRKQKTKPLEKTKHFQFLYF